MNVILTSSRRYAALFIIATSVIIQSKAQQEFDDEVFILSPFTVETTSDVGYLAQNTLAGSRLNSSLKDTGAAISVITLEFLDDVAATSMKDIILFANNSVPEYGDSAPNYNGNPMVGSEQWLLRIRGLPATYARNYFEWETSTDFYNVERIDQSRGPNAILFGFGPAGGLVNTSTKKASLDPIDHQLSFMLGSWNRYRASLDWNQVAVTDTFAVRLNVMTETSESWREFEDYQANRLHLAATWKVSEQGTLRAEIETGEVQDNIARTWLAIDQAWQWRQDGRPTYDGSQWDWPISDSITQTWSPHIVYIANNGSVMDWQGMPYTYLASSSWSHLEMNAENLAIIPRESNLAGPGAVRDNDYTTYTLNYEHRINESLSFELSYNHQWNDFRGYDANAGNLTRYGYQGDATNIWGDASNWLPNWEANPYAGELYLENNWTRRTNNVKIDNLRATLAYEFDLGKAGHHRVAAMVQRTERDYYSREDAEVWLGAQFGEGWDSPRNQAEFDSNRVFRRYYFQAGSASDIHVPTWDNPLTYEHWSGTYTSGWVPNQQINNHDQTQDTILLGLQSYFADDRLVTTVGFRKDKLEHRTLATNRDANGVLGLDPNDVLERTLEPDTMSLGAVFHISDQVSVFANTSNSRALPNFNQRLIGIGQPPMPEGTGSDIGVKLDLLEGKLYATINYYKTDFENTTEWGNINADVTSRNNNFLWSFYDAGLISASERDARLLDANAYLEDRKSDGWEFELIANPTTNWRITANFSITNVVKENIMSEVVSWADEATAYWVNLAGADYNFGGGDWDVLGNHIGWMMDGINRETAFNGKQARGERGYGASVYTRYFFTEGALEGFSVGGGMRYQAPNAITYVDNELIEGEDLFLTDLVLGYAFEFTAGSRPISVDLQFNVSNLFDEDKNQVYTVAWWDATRAERIGLQEPRKFTLSATLKL